MGSNPISAHQICTSGGMVDTLDLGSSAARHKGSSPFEGTKQFRDVYPLPDKESKG